MDFRSDLIIDVKTKEETLDVSRLDMLSLLEIDGWLAELLHQCEGTSSASSRPGAFCGWETSLRRI